MNVGDIVRLNSGGPAMIVVGADDTNVSVVWSGDGAQTEGTFQHACVYRIGTRLEMPTAKTQDVIRHMQSAAEAVLVDLHPAEQERQGDGWKVEITSEMVATGARLVREWEDSGEPDARVLVRALLSTVLGSRATFAHAP